ncbi:hypothetical protein CKO25_10405 [Thiocapsa imhoffii]|uniref:Uncharacterized protein n=1 Tax=Thiocapsa imhoffii TaxID=382777 RepID=A0A9X0WIC8_9GAMM|nr:hypothetical protein [Thiocapsa imhoffii]
MARFSDKVLKPCLGGEFVDGVRPSVPLEARQVTPQPKGSPAVTGALQSHHAHHAMPITLYREVPLTRLAAIR